MAHQARKRFGQHFLTDTSLVEKMVRHIAPKDSELLVEIGPGQGALTLPLLDVIQHLHVVELDRDLVADLERRIAGQRLTIHHADALQFSFAGLLQNAATSEQQKLRVVGNLPYNISTPLIFHLIDQVESIGDMHFMLQKEVVDRLTAVPGTPDWGRLSVMVQYHCRADYLFFVPPTAFSPPPKVDSAVVRLVPHGELPHPALDIKVLRQIVSQAFTQRRKVISNGLKSFLSAADIEAAGVDAGLRPDALTVAHYVALANRVVQGKP